MPLGGLFGKGQQPKKRDNSCLVVCSPHGSTGKTTVATNLAIELAASKNRVLLIDADSRGPAIANHFCLSQLPPGLPAALRLAKQNRLDHEQLERLTVPIAKTNLQVLPGSLGKVLGTENQDAFANLIASCRELFDFVVVDTESLSHDCEAEAYSLLALADDLLMVVAADPVGIQRWLEIEAELTNRGLVPTLIINRLRNSVLSSAKREINQTLERLSETSVSAFLPDDSTRLDQATRSGLPLALNARSGGFRQSLSGFVATQFLGQGGALDGRVAKLG